MTEGEIAPRGNTASRPTVGTGVEPGARWRVGTSVELAVGTGVGTGVGWLSEGSGL
jgi:hypothetical protein